MSAPKHRVTFTVVKRAPDGIATRWEARCGRHSTFDAATYEDVEDAWRRHVYEETGRVPEPAGNRVGRWTPGGAR